MLSAISRIHIDDQEVKKISQWIAMAAILQISESLIPHPVPGLRLGLANMVALIVMVNYGFTAAITVNLLRTIISSFILGTFMSPGFMLSFASALTGTLVMGLLYNTSIKQKIYFSLMGISIAGAFVHNITQITLAYILIIRHPGIFAFLPWLTISALLTGFVTGIIAYRITDRLRNHTSGRMYMYYGTGTDMPFELRNYISGNSLIHKLPPELKILSIVLLALVVLLTKDLLVLMAVLAGIVLLIVANKLPLLKVLTGLIRLLSFILMAFLIPVLLNREGATVFSIGSLPITGIGLAAGTIYSLRLIILVLYSSTLMRTASSIEFTIGMEKVLSPLRVFGIDHYRISKILSMSWQWMPELWKEIRGIIRFIASGREKGIKKRITAIVDFMVYLFQN